MLTGIVQLVGHVTQDREPSDEDVLLLCPQTILLSVDKHGQVIKESQDSPAMAELG